MSLIFRIFAGPIIVAVLSTPPLQADQKAKVTIKFATLTPKGAADTYERIQDAVRQATGNEVNILESVPGKRLSANSIPKIS